MRDYIPPVAGQTTNRDRLVALGPVLLLHLAFLFAFLHLHTGQLGQTSMPDREIVLLLRPAPAAPNWRGDLIPSLGSTAIGLLQTMPIPRPENEAAPASRKSITTGLQGVSQALFRCWPPSRAALAEVQDAQCLSFAPDRSSVFLEPRERSRNAAEWRRDLDRKNAPLRLPCLYGIAPQMIPATAFCVANGLLNGFDLPSYAEDDTGEHASGVDAIRHDMQTVDPCELDRTYGFGFVCLYRVVNGNAPP